MQKRIEHKSVKTVLKNYGLILLCITLLISGFILSETKLRSTQKNAVFCFQDGNLATAINLILPSEVIHLSKPQNALYRLENGARAVEAFEYTANAALRQNLANNWYPLYTTSFVIVVNRNMVKEKIEQFSDLAALNASVSIPSDKMTLNNLFATLAFSHDDKQFDIRRATEQLLTPLKARQLLVFDNNDAAIVICYDYQAATLIDSKPNRVVIAPANRLQFNGGLLSKEPLSAVQSNITQLQSHLTNLSYRTLDRTKLSQAVYNEHALLNLLADVPRSIRRQVNNSYHFQTADGREHFFVGILFVTIVVIWSLSFYVRSSQKTMRKTIALNGFLLVTWLSIRIVKYLLYESILLDGYLWYSYYIPILLLPINILWLSAKCDKLHDDGQMPAFVKWLFLINLPIIALIFSNNLHNLFFLFDTQRPDWNRNYSYGPLFWPMYAFMFIEYLSAIFILVHKAFKSKQKQVFIMPLGVVLLTILISLFYVNRLLPQGFDITLAMVILIMIFFETALRSGLISVNTNYGKIFKLSTLNMQILNCDGEPVLSARSEKMPLLDSAILRQSEQFPMFIDDNTRLHVQPINSGYVCYLTDISQVNQLRQNLSLNIKKLQNIRQLLTRQKQIKQAAATAKVKVNLYNNLQRQIQQDVERLNDYINRLRGAQIAPHEIAVIALDSCYLKRCANWFFRERTHPTIAIEDLQLYMEELSEIAHFSAIDVLIVQRADNDIPTVHGSLIYKFFYRVLLALREHKRKTLLVQIVSNPSEITVNFMPSGGALSLSIDQELKESIKCANATYIEKDLDDAFGISLHFTRSTDK